MWKKITSDLVGDGYKPAPHFANCEDCGAEMEMASIPSSDPDDTRLFTSVRCSNESCKSRAKTSSVKTADADVIQFPTFDDESHERITNAINNGHICHFGVMGCGYNKGYIEGTNHPELASPDCPVHGTGGSMERHPAGKGDRKLDEDTELADVIPIKRKGSIMTNEFNNRQDEDSFGLWYDEDEFEPKQAAFWNPFSWAPNAINAVSGLDKATDELEQASQNQINVETAIAEAPATGVDTSTAAQAAYTPSSEQGNLAVSDKAAEMAGSKKPEGPVHDVVKGAQGRTDAINSLIKSTSVQEVPQWIEDAREIIAHDHSEWQAEQAQDEATEGQINDRLSDPGCPSGECDMPSDEHCQDCNVCPGEAHDRYCPSADYDDSMDGDFDSAMASAGFGTDEDYGSYGGDDW